MRAPRGNSHRAWWAGVMIIALAALVAVPQMTSADSADPDPSPLFQNSLEKSIDRFDQQAGGALPHRRVVDSRLAGGGASTRTIPGLRVLRVGMLETGMTTASYVEKPRASQSQPGATKGVMTGGEDIATATVIPSLPYSDAGSTVGAIDNYNEICPYNTPSGADVVYAYTAPFDQQIDIDLCTSLYDTRVWVYENTETPGAPYDCNDDACGSDGFKSRLECMPVTGGNTYFIVIAGYAGATGDYTLNVTESDPIACAPCIWPGCAPGATPEGEACGANPDVTNGGCNSSPEVYSTLGYGETACGESWADVMRDTDWWRTDLTDADSLTWFVTASFDFAVVLLDITSYVPGEGCASPNIVQLASGEFTDCDTVMVAASLNPGSYVVFIAPVFGSTYSCTDGPWEYQITLNPDDAVTSDFFNSDAEICLILDADNPCLPPVPDPVILTGPVEVQRPPSPYPPGTPSVSIPIEIVEMSLSGSTPFGPVQLRNSHTLPSLGQIITPDIDPLGNFQSAPESFFDVFVEIDVELVELKLVNRDPIPVFSGPITQLPPLGTPYRTLPSQAPIPIYIDGTPPEAPPVGWICYVIHTPTTPLECFCIYQLSCVSGPADEAAKLDMCVGDLRAGSMCTCVGGTCAGSFHTQIGNLCLEWISTGVCEPTALPPVPGTAGGCACNPAPTMPSSPTCPGETTCEGTSTCVGAQSCQGSSTCPGFATCIGGATCAAIETCHSVTCTAEPTCAGSLSTCSGQATCDWYPTCGLTPTCAEETCVGWSTCVGSQTCQGVPTCDPPPTYQGPACENPTMAGSPSCHGSSTCEGFFTCMGATCAAIETCQSVTCTSEPTCWGSSATCSPNLTCPGYPSCDGTATCGATISTCIGSATCKGSSTCDGAPTCEQPTFTGPTCQPTSCNGVSCAGVQCPPTMACDPSCPPLGHCPTGVGQPSCAAGGICPTIIGAPSCTGGNCITIDGPSCSALCPTMSGFWSCDAVSCVPPTSPGRPTCDAILCPPTWFADLSCPGDPTCWPTIAPFPSCQGTPTCALIPCPPPTMPGNPTCAGGATCPATPTCNPFGLTCAGVATCAPAASCAAATCPAVASCPGSATCNGTNTCVGGHTCAGNPTCRTTATCVAAQATCTGTATCNLAATCGGWPTCNGTATCNGVATCDAATTCNGRETCPGAASCAGVATCDGSPTCRFSATCDGWPTCQPPPYDVSTDLKILLDSLDYSWVELHFGPDTTDAFEYDDWHWGPLNPLMIWDEADPLLQGEFVITKWLRPDVDSARVDTEYVRVLYEVGIDRHRDSNGDGRISVSDYLLLHFRSPAALDSVSSWYHVEAIGKSQAGNVKFVIKLKSAIPPEILACACDCHADPACDGVTNVLDVVNAVNVAFKGAPPMPDPNPACPFETTDVDCTGFTNVLDVVHLVNVAFKGGDPAVEFCSPCGP